VWFRHRQGKFICSPVIYTIKANIFLLAHSRSPWYRPCRLARRQASSPACWCPRCLHCLCWFHQDPREHPQGHLRCRVKLLRFLDTQSVEGDQADPQPVGGVQRRSPGRKEVLDCGRRNISRVWKNKLHLSLDVLY